MLRLIIQNHMMGPLISSLVSKGNSSDILRSYFSPPSTLNRRFHLLTEAFTKIHEFKMMAAKKGRKDKMAAKKGRKDKMAATKGRKPAKPEKKEKEVCEEENLKALERGGSCPQRLTPKCCVTLRPEDATAAACAAKAAEAAARRAALSAKNCEKSSKKAEKPSEPPVREHLCAAHYQERSKYREPLDPPSKEERLMPQSTKPWIHSRYADLSEKMASSPIAAAYRPVAQPIHVCTPQEVRKMFTPPEKPCEMTSKQRFRRRTGKLFFFIVKVAFAAFIVTLTIDLGIWNSSDSASQIFSAWVYGKEDELPHLEAITYSVKETWNCAVRSVFRFIGRLIPAMAERFPRRGSHSKSEYLEV